MGLLKLVKEGEALVERVEYGGVIRTATPFQILHILSEILGRWVFLRNMVFLWA